VFDGSVERMFMDDPAARPIGPPTKRPTAPGQTRLPNQAPEATSTA